MGPPTGSRLARPARRLSLGVLRRFAGFVQPDFLALHFSGIAGHKASLSQRASKRLIVAHQGPGNAMPNGAGLTGTATAGDADRYVDLILKFCRLKRLAHYHPSGFPAEVGIQASLIHGDVPSAARKIDASNR